MICGWLSSLVLTIPNSSVKRLLVAAKRLLVSVMASSSCCEVGLEEEVDHVYERLQVLEADREFLKHCISSLRKGDKGLDLLQEILQRLRDLRNVELKVRNIGDLAV
ncbi:hypothetical protein TSUD_67460 [Trifolium subterraneum]|uniref:Uncharacterized protein n=1 Tax=Trifolium subterraneum TaxID=3900 RepID=A0A2Z6N9V6_TRISU|nr:hypothetical protein TSUD_67460 [Trifolium subterraneum]